MAEGDLGNIHVVLVGTTHPGNIGASARAMKTMGLKHLVLVEPQSFPSAEATAMASGADDILSTARICTSLDEAVRGCGLVIAASARTRSIAWPQLDPDQCAEQISRQAAETAVAIVFGREHSGLSNAELDRCHAMVQIPTQAGFRSLNVAAAVQILAYVIRAKMLGPADTDRPRRLDGVAPATAEELRALYAHLEATMTAVGFYDPAKPRRLMRRLKRLFNRSLLDHNEVQILRGFLAAVDERLKRRP